MGSERPGNTQKVKSAGSGAAAATGGVAAGSKGNAAGRDNIITYNYKITSARGLLYDKGPRTSKGMGDPDRAWDRALDGEIEVGELREMLLNGPPQKVKALKQKPKLVKVKGLLYPCALLVSGWWDSQPQKVEGLEWNDVQKWLFRGFNEWGPSWDYTWDFEHAEKSANQPYFVAQLGEGDEANSIPIIIPPEKARKLSEKFQERGHEIGVGVGALPARVTGVLCHRSLCPKAAGEGQVGGILDYCVWLKPGEDEHKVSPDKGKPDFYSGYLWKCLAPKYLYKEGQPLALNQVYFVWEHTNFADQNSVKYNLDSLEHKEAYIRKVVLEDSELVLLQKSSILVPGEPKWTKEAFSNFYKPNEEDI